MIRTNLSTRPFYNERSVQMILLVVAVIAVAFTAFNASRVLRYSRSDTRLQTQAARDEARAADLRQQATRLRGTVNPKQIESASLDAREANDQGIARHRTFDVKRSCERIASRATTFALGVHAARIDAPGIDGVTRENRQNRRDRGGEVIVKHGGRERMGLGRGGFVFEAASGESDG